MKKIFSLLIAVVLCFGFASSIAAESDRFAFDSQITPYYVALNTITSSLSISSAGRASCLGQATARSSDITINVVMELKKQSGSGWINVDSWSGSGSGASGVTLSQAKSGLDKGSYVLTVTAKVYQGNTLLETVSKDSKIVTY